MAWTEFYMQPTGSNLNAGSTTDDAASVTTTNGGWDTATRVFTAASGTPFSGVVAGEWASIYLDAATATPFIAQVESVGGGGASITVSATNRLGTQPLTGASGRSCKVGGAWASFAIVATGAVFAAGTAGTPMRLNVKTATYANTTSFRSLGASGATTAPIWIRGYNSTIGDLDNTADASRPEVTFTTGALSGAGSFVIISNINFSVSSGTDVAVALSGNHVTIQRCKITNAGTNSAISASGAAFQMLDCYCSASSSAAVTGNLTGTNQIFVRRCVFSGGTTSVAAPLGSCICDSLFLSPTGDGVRVTSGTINRTYITDCVFYGCGGDGIEFTSFTNSSPGFVISGCVFSNCGGYAINSSSGTNTAAIKLSGNLYYNNTSGNLNGFGDTPDFESVTDSASPFVDAAGGDFTLASTSNGYGLSRKLENVATTSYADIGAVQHQNPAAGAGGARLVGASALVTPGGCY